jgi:hypothetical protein
MATVNGHKINETIRRQAVKRPGRDWPVKVTWERDDKQASIEGLTVEDCRESLAHQTRVCPWREVHKYFA